MKNNSLFDKFLKEDVSQSKDCIFCKEANLEVGDRTKYGGLVICKVGDSSCNGWFATLSPKTGGDPNKDFTIQLMLVCILLILLR